MEMRRWIFLLIVIFCFAIVSAKRNSGDHESDRERHVRAHLEEKNNRSSKIKEADDRRENRVNRDGTPLLKNPCAKVRCKKGKECSLDKNNSPKCVCIQECSTMVTIDDKVCGTDNKTYESECVLRRLKCLGSNDRNIKKTLRKLKVNYLGECKMLTSCKKSEMKEYPTRMRSWLKNVFLEMYDTPEEEGGLSPKQRYHGRKVFYEKDRLQDFEETEPHDIVEREFKKFYPLYKYPIHWKFAELDKKPKDMKLSKRELEPLRAPLIPMEHCTKSFFKRADKNKDKKISLQEWGHALGLEEGDIDSKLIV
ncbi:SPARC-like [Styela clava]